VSEEPRDRAGEASLDSAEVAPLFAGLHDSSAEVRIAMLQALTRLPLAPSDWMKVGVFAAWVFESTSTSEERRAVIDIAPWIPLHSIHDLVARLAVEGEEEEVRAHAGEAAARLAHPEAPWEVFEGSPLRPAWADGEPPGFSTYSASELSKARAEQARLLQPFESDPGWRVDDDEPLWRLNERVMAPVLERDLAPAAVTVLCERAVNQQMVDYWWPGNKIVAWVQEVQGRFRPDLDGLFAQYWRLAVERGLGNQFLGAGDESGPRTLCWQIGWTVSRGGLRGLVPGLAAHLAGEDRTERIAAAFLIADAADYILQPHAPLFGGGFGPERPASAPLPGGYAQLLGDGEPVSFDQYICPQGDYRWPVLGVDDPVPPPQECPVHHIPLVFQRAGSSTS
jgi:hypothetical protein